MEGRCQSSSSECVSRSFIFLNASRSRGCHKTGSHIHSHCLFVVNFCPRCTHKGGSREWGTGTHLYPSCVTRQLSLKHCFREFHYALQKLQPTRAGNFRGDMLVEKKNSRNACFAVISSFMAGNGRRAFMDARACLSYALSIHSGELALVTLFDCKSRPYFCRSSKANHPQPALYVRGQIFVIQRLFCINLK